MIQFLQPFQGRLPTTEQEFITLQSHIPNNLGQLLRGNRQARPGEYYAGPEEGQATDPAASSSGQDQASAFPTWAEQTWGEQP
eukprot:13058834-Alexandrium_andersonii.AAC.1